MKLNKKKSLAVAMLSVFAGQTYAAGLERSPQQIDALFEQGTYAEVGYTHISPDITGKDASGNYISDMAGDFQSLNYAVKTDLNSKLRLAVIYDEPFGAKVEFDGANNFIATDRPAADAKTRVDVKSKNVTALLGYKLNENVMVYGGPALQEIEAEVHLRGLNYALNSGYNNTFDDIAVGWVTGISYAKPEIGLLASLTYRSEVEHKTTIQEDVPLADLLGMDYSHSNQGSITTPESINLNLQTGLNMTTAVFAKVRYVPWSDFAYYPPILKASTTAALGKGLPLVDYSEDQIAVELGLGKRLSPKLAIAVFGFMGLGGRRSCTDIRASTWLLGRGLSSEI